MDDNLAGAVAIPLMLFIFACFCLVMVFAFYHLVRALAAVNQLKEQIAQQYLEHRPKRTAPPTRTPNAEELIGNDADLEEAVRMGREAYSENGERTEDRIVTHTENAHLNDEEPITETGFYRGR